MRIFPRIVLISTAAAATCLAAAEEPIRYSRDVARILSNNCFACHGPDENERKGGLRLDTYEGATAQLRSGNTAIVPGDPDAGTLLERILTHDPDDRMPPPDKGAALPEKSIAILREWIAQGANYETHWSFEKPERPEPPAVSGEPRSPIDQFVQARLEQEGLMPNPEASREVWLRRVSLDLTGLPPTREEREAFLADTESGAYERVVDGLLASPHFGERWAQMWLDIARYADTKGYEADRPRTIWPYRDWVIDALNDDMPFDQFTAEQLAGDLLPDPTLEQRIATAFHRNTMTNDEGGTDNEEFRTAAVVDRVNTTMEAWMGITMACAQCHTHKYDPITIREYYQVFDFFNQSADADTFPVESPVLRTPSEEHQVKMDALRDESRDARRVLKNAVDPGGTRTKAEEFVWGSWYQLGPIRCTDYNTALHTDFVPEGPVDLASRRLDESIYWQGAPDIVDGQVYAVTEENSAYYFYRTIEVPRTTAAELSFGSDDGLRVWLNGALIAESDEPRGAAADQNVVMAGLLPGVNTLLVKVVNGGAGGGLYFALKNADHPPALGELLASNPDDRTEEQRAAFEQYQEARALVARLDQEKQRLESSIPEIPVMEDLPEDQRRVTRIFERGSFLNPGDEVSAEVPQVFHEFPEDAPRNRLGLAQWLVSEENPLTARVMVNRVWERLFGNGIVASQEDFGTQGEWPTHPELLDWLAVEYMDQGWSLKKLCKTITLSGTYRQSSAATPEKLEKDQYNRWYSRGPRFRLPAELIRDQALRVAGLLSDKMHGPPVMPPQPDGVWQIVYSGDQWRNSKGEDRYRRGLYTYWRRTSPYPSMMAFDATSREVCTVKRTRTNTPLQALVTLNDPVYVEAAQALARRAVEEGGVSMRRRAQWLFTTALGRVPSRDELDALLTLYRAEHAHFREDEEAALAMATKPIGPLPEDEDAHTLAAWTVVGNAVMNTDEFLSKP